MIKKIAAALLEGLHLMATGFLFTLSSWVAPLPGPVRAWKGSAFAETGAGGAAKEIQDYLLARSPWLAALGLIALASAGFLRGPGKGLLPALRLAASAAALLFALWAFMDLPSHRLPHAWNCLWVSSGSTLLLAGFLIGGGKGGKSSTSKSES